MREIYKTQVRSLGWKDPLEKGMATHSSILGWIIPWTEEPGRPQSIGLQRVRHDWSDLAIAAATWRPRDQKKKKKVLLITGCWNTKVGSQEIPGVTGKFGPGVWNKEGQRLTEFCQENALVIAHTLFNNMGDNITHGYHQMVNTETKLITLFVAKDWEIV